MPTPETDALPENDSVRLAMQLAWQDHHHARDQTWKTLQVEAVLGAALITVDVQSHNFIATLFAAILVALAAYFGILISLHHRKLELRKFTHIMNCEQFLGLRRPDLIPWKKDDPVGGVELPMPFSFWDAFRIWKKGRIFKGNTAIFILRMHLAIIGFAIIVAVSRYYH